MPEGEIRASLDAVGPEVTAALESAAQRIRLHHEAQIRPDVTHEDAGVRITSTNRPVPSAGCYVPGGRAAYPSTLLMTALVARVAGVERVVVCVPPDSSTGRVAPVTLAAAAVAGVDEVYAVGGAQAIAAMAHGTETIEPVEVICGPGNMYVAVAKQEVAGEVGVAAAFAGPSEVVVVADASVPAELVAIDLMLQAEHGPDGLAWLVTWDPDVADAVDVALGELIAGADRAREIEATLQRSGWSVLVDSPGAALAVTDSVAPEHLELMCEDAEALAARVRNAGAVFCGPWSPASLGDYIAGPSHVLPTHRSARFASALGIEDFTKQIHVVTADAAGLEAVGEAAVVLAEAEGLGAHAESVRMRLRMLASGDADPTGARGSEP
ncbi:MAG: histidinol dehydrogenase [Microthrixaceae bacterium]